MNYLTLTTLFNRTAWADTLLPVLLLIFACVGQTYANPILVQQRVSLLNTNIDDARNTAVEAAIKSVLLRTGGSVQANAQISNGIVQQDTFNIAHQGKLQSATILHEVHTQDELIVDINVELIDMRPRCEMTPNQRKSVTSSFYFADLHSSQENDMQDLALWIPTKIQQYFALEHSTLAISHIDSTPWYPGLRSSPTASIELGKKFNAQYIISGQIDDISTQRTYPKAYAFWQKEKAQRQFAARVAVYDTFTGTRIFDRGYQFATQWHDPLTASTNIRSRQFTQSPYGSKIMATIAQIQQDIEHHIQCAPQRARVIGIDQQTVIIDIGEQQGVNTDTLFALSQYSEQLGAQGTNIRITTPHQAHFEVVSIMSSTTVIKRTTGMLTQNIQHHDWVTVLP